MVQATQLVWCVRWGGMPWAKWLDQPEPITTPLLPSCLLRGGRALALRFRNWYQKRSDKGTEVYQQVRLSRTGEHRSVEISWIRWLSSTTPGRDQTHWGLGGSYGMRERVEAGVLRGPPAKSSWGGTPVVQVWPLESSTKALSGWAFVWQKGEQK